MFSEPAGSPSPWLACSLQTAVHSLTGALGPSQLLACSFYQELSCIKTAQAHQLKSKTKLETISNQTSLTHFFPFFAVSLYQSFNDQNRIISFQNILLGNQETQMLQLITINLLKQRFPKERMKTLDHATNSFMV